MRECRQRRKTPRNGTRSRSKRGASTDKCAGLEVGVANELGSFEQFGLHSAAKVCVAEKLKRPTSLRCAGFRVHFLFIPLASADGQAFFSLARKHVVVHADHHWDENNCVVKKVELHAREEQLENAARDRFAPEIMVRRRLNNQE